MASVGRQSAGRTVGEWTGWQAGQASAGGLGWALGSGGSGGRETEHLASSGLGEVGGLPM